VSAIGERVTLVRRSARLERVRALVPRLLLFAALAATCLVGARELISPREPGPAMEPEVAVDHAAEEFAQGFARAYLTWDAQRPGLRDRALARYAPEDLDAGAGLIPPAQGKQAVAWTAVAQNQEALAGGRIVVVAAGIEGTGEILYLAIPVGRREDGALALAGYPSLVGRPLVGQGELPDRESVDDPEFLSVAERVVRNYLAGERQDLVADLTVDASVSIPDQRLEVESVEEIAWAAGPESGAVLVTVAASDAASAVWTLTYELGLERLGGRVLVSFVETLANDT
jgi:Conjugative transposon protein TcpC